MSIKLCRIRLYKCP